MKLRITIFLLMLAIGYSHAQFGSAIVPETPEEGPFSGDNTVLCAYITRQCQVRCGERRRAGKVQIQYVQWAVNIQQTMVSCNTFEVIDVPIYPSPSQTNIVFNVPCCAKNESQGRPKPSLPIETTTITTTEKQTNPPIIIHPQAPTACASSSLDFDEVETKLFAIMLCSAISAGLALVVCFLIIMLGFMFKKSLRRKPKKMQSDSPSFVYKNMLNPEETSTSHKPTQENSPKGNIEGNYSTSNGIAVSKRPLPNFPNKAGNLRNDYKEEVLFQQPTTVSQPTKYLFQPIDTMPEALLGHSKFDTNLPSRRVTVNDSVSGAKSDIIVDRRHDSMPTPKDLQNKDTQTDENGIISHPGNNPPDAYVYCQLGSESKIIRSKGEYSLLRLSEYNKIGKRQSVPSLLSATNQAIPNDNSVDEPEVNYLNTNSNKPRTEISDYVDVETSYVKTMSPKTNKTLQRNVEVNQILSAENNKEKKSRESAYVFAEDVKKEIGIVSKNQETLSQDHSSSIEYKYSDGTTLTMTESDDL